MTNRYPISLLTVHTCPVRCFAVKSEKCREHNHEDKKYVASGAIPILFVRRDELCRSYQLRGTALAGLCIVALRYEDEDEAEDGDSEGEGDGDGDGDEDRDVCPGDDVSRGSD